jgi:DNA-directed RNA polymerase alpha subunit
VFARQGESAELANLDYLKFLWPYVDKLNAAGIYTVAELVQHTDAQLLKIPYLGRKSINAIEKVLALHGLKLGMPGFAERTGQTVNGSAPMPSEFLQHDLGNSGLPNSIVDCLKNEKIHSIAELIQRTEDELLKIPKIGEKSICKIKGMLILRGLKLRSASLVAREEEISDKSTHTPTEFFPCDDFHGLYVSVRDLLRIL